MLLDGGGEVVTSNLDVHLDPQAVMDSESVVQNGKESYIVVKQRSELTGWTLAVLTPLRETTEGVSILRTALFVSGIIGVVLFLVMSFFCLR